MGWRSLSLWLFFLALGCHGRALTERVVFGPILEMHQGTVALFEEESVMPIVFAEIGFLRVRSYGALASEEVVLNQLRTEAATLGANAIIHLTITRSTGAVIATGVAVHVP